MKAKAARIKNGEYDGEMLTRRKSGETLWGQRW